MNSINENGCSVCQPVAVVAFHFDLVKVGCSIQPPATIEY